MLTHREMERGREGKKLHFCSDPDRDRHAQARVKGKKDSPQERTNGASESVVDYD